MKTSKLYTRVLTIKEIYRNQGKLSEESLESLIEKVKKMEDTVADMNEIDFCIMRQFKTALETEKKEPKEIHEGLLAVLEGIKVQCQDSLRKMHESFRCHILEYKNIST